MRALGPYYDEVEKENRHYADRLHAFLQLSFPTLEMVFSKSSLHFLNIVQHYPHQDIVRILSLEEVIDTVKQTSHKNISLQKAEEKAKLIISAAASAYSAINITDDRYQPLKDCAHRIVELKQQKKER